MKHIVSAVSLVLFAACAWGATHEVGDSLGASAQTKGKSLSGFCLDGDENLVVADEGDSCLRVIAPDDTLKACWQLDFAPQAVAWCPSNHTVLVAGSGQIAVLDAAGKVLRAADLPGATGLSAEKLRLLNPVRRAAFMKNKQVTATAVTAAGADIFVTVQSRTGFSVHRLDASLTNSVEIIKGLRGCCGQMDVMASGDTLYVAANCDFEVSKYDRDGKKTGAIKKPKGSSVFDGCCEPKNVFMGSDGVLYVAESGQCAVNRFNPADGTHLGEVGRIKDIGGCVRVTVAATRDGSRVYMLDTDRNTVRILKLK